MQFKRVFRLRLFSTLYLLNLDIRLGLCYIAVHVHELLEVHVLGLRLSVQVEQILEVGSAGDVQICFIRLARLNDRLQRLPGHHSCLYVCHRRRNQAGLFVTRHRELIIDV